MKYWSYTTLLAVALILGLLTACGPGAAPPDPADYEAEILDWRAGRLARLTAPDGYLNLAGLFWLSAETVRFGSSADNDIVFPASAAPRIGEFRLTDNGVVMVPVPGVDVRVNDEQVGEILLRDDTTEVPVTVTHGSLAWLVIRRDGRYAVRLRDFEHPVLDSFPTLDYFPIDPSLRVPAMLVRYDEPKVAAVDTVIEGLGWNPESPGILTFEIDGQRLKLEAYASGERLFLVFGDRSNGKETYPAGRFLYADPPDDGGLIWLDFNRAYSPPCAFNDFSTCPIPTARNRVPVVIAAGEKYDRSKFAGSFAQ